MLYCHHLGFLINFCTWTPRVFIFHWALEMRQQVVSSRQLSGVLLWVLPRRFNLVSLFLEVTSYKLGIFQYCWSVCESDFWEDTESQSYLLVPPKHGSYDMFPWYSSHLSFAVKRVTPTFWYSTEACPFKKKSGDGIDTFDALPTVSRFGFFKMEWEPRHLPSSLSAESF